MCILSQQHKYGVCSVNTNVLTPGQYFFCGDNKHFIGRCKCDFFRNMPSVQKKMLLMLIKTIPCVTPCKEFTTQQTTKQIHFKHVNGIRI